MRMTLAAMLMLATTAGDAALAQVSLRGQADPVAGDVASVSPAGVVVVVGGSAAGGGRTIGWDRVREVHGEHGAEAARQLDVFKDLWRARLRLERGDYVAAEPTFEALAPGQRGVVGPTPTVVFDGLTRCRLKRGATLGAVWAWLDWVRARGGDIGGSADPSAIWTGGKIDGAPVIEAKSGLLVSTPPIFLHDAALDAGVSSDEWIRFVGVTGGGGTDDVVAQLAMLYRAAARFEAELPPELGAVTSVNDSVRLVADIVQARVGDEKQREAARASLKARLEQRDLEPWVECWCRIGMGRSLIRESDSDMMRQGIIQLLHVPSRFPRVSGYAASVALAESAMMLHDLGDEAGATTLKNELLDRYARSNAAGWPRLREIKVGPATGKSAAPAEAPAGKDAPANGQQGRGG